MDLSPVGSESESGSESLEKIPSQRARNSASGSKTQAEPTENTTNGSGNHGGSGNHATVNINVSGNNNTIHINVSGNNATTVNDN